MINRCIVFITKMVMSAMEEYLPIVYIVMHPGAILNWLNCISYIELRYHVFLLFQTEKQDDWKKWQLSMKNILVQHQSMQALSQKLPIIIMIMQSHLVLENWKVCKYLEILQHIAGSRNFLQSTMNVDTNFHKEGNNHSECNRVHCQMFFMEWFSWKQVHQRNMPKKKDPWSVSKCVLPCHQSLKNIMRHKCFIDHARACCTV